MILAHAPGLIVLKAFIWSLLNIVAIVVAVIAVLMTWSQTPRRRSQLWWVALPLCFGIVSLFWLHSTYAGWLFMCFGAVPLVCSLGALVGWLTRHAKGAEPDAAGNSRHASH
jgi:hypothetical protein